MKKTTWIRLIVVLAILAGWGWSMLPLRDRDFFDTLQSLAKPRLEALRKQDTPEAKKALAEFDRLLADARAARKADSRLAPLQAVARVADGDDIHRRMRLDQYIAVPGMGGAASNSSILAFARKQASGKIKLGMDIRGGSEFVVGFDPASKAGDDRRSNKELCDTVVEIMRRRVNPNGQTDAEVKAIGPTAVSVRVPNVTQNERDDIRHSIMAPAKLAFHLVLPESRELAARYRQSPDTVEIPLGYDYKEIDVELNGQVEKEGLFIKHRPEAVRGADLERAIAMQTELGMHTISLKFNPTGARAFGEITSNNVGQRMAIVLDGRVYSAPTIRVAILDGQAEISGSFTRDEASQLAVVLQSGQLPVAIRIDSEFGTDPTLGTDSVHAGFLAGIVGAIAVIIFMLIYYHLSGIVAIIAMIANIFLQIGTMAVLGATFTLPGIAGIVLTIGMAVDANILIYERFREEMAAGKSLASAIEAGFSRAFWTIFDSHVTALIAGVVLYYYGTGPVKGFAATLVIGVIANLFTSLVVSRLMFDGLLSAGLKKLTMFHIFRQVPHINFMGMRRFFFAFSIVLTAMAIGLVVFRFSRGEALSTDFTGGSTITYQYDEKCTPPEVGVIRTEISNALGVKEVRVGYKAAALQNERNLEITIPAGKTETVDAVTKTILAKFPQAKFEQKQTYSVGGLVGEQFRKKAIWALVLSCAAIIIYLAFRFEFAYGVAAVIAIVHDVIVAAGVGAFCDVQLSLTVLAALLTIIGYSVNDTIVVFDRIRESFSLKRGMTYAEVVNLSINQTLSRTMLTSVTVFFCVLALYLFGGGAIHDFALIMLSGVVVGTYSSVFVASAIIVSWHKRLPHHLVSEESNVTAAAAPEEP